MEKIALSYVFYYLVFPGFIFLAVAGMVMSWVDRKLTARFQWRMGPPFFQPGEVLEHFVHILLYLRLVFLQVRAESQVRQNREVGEKPSPLGDVNETALHDFVNAQTIYPLVAEPYFSR